MVLMQISRLKGNFVYYLLSGSEYTIKNDHILQHNNIIS